MTSKRTLIPVAFSAPVVLAVLAALVLTSPAGSVTGLKHPDLGMAPLTDFFLDKPADGRKLLRFSATMVNVGSGPMELNATRAVTTAGWSVSQRIHGADGSALQSVPNASLIWGGDGHNHWHVSNIERYDLVRQDNGVKVGTGAKGGFCFFDTTAYRLSLPGAPTAAQYRTANGACGYNNESSLSVTMGISVGWGDRYAYTLPGQYVDVTNLSPGKYRLIATVDPDNWFAETSESNNSTWADITVTTHRKTGTTLRITATGPSA